MRIFVAEDNPADIYLLREALGIEKNRDIELMVVEDGEEALDFVQRRHRFASVPLPDLVVLDLNLPKTDGSEILRAIRGSSDFRAVPVVILTSSDSPRDRTLAEELGANGFVTKPSNLDAFLSLGERLRNFAETTRATQGQA